MKIKILDKALYEQEISAGFAPKQPGDAGIDLRATEDVEISIRQTAKIPLGVAVEIPVGTVGWLTGRSSSTLAFGLMTHEGKIDAGYRGEIHAIVTALERGCHIARGERIAQLVVLPIMTPDKMIDNLRVISHGWSIEENLTETKRGKYGLGSTGRT